MSVSTLANTKWVINNEINEFFLIPQSFNINFSSNGSNFNSFDFNFGQDYWYIYYGSIKVYDENVWSNQSYRIIEITGGTDATNATLIAWLEANATQVQVVDLSNTKWVFNSYIELIQTSFTLNFTSNNMNYTSMSYRAMEQGWLMYDSTLVYQQGSEAVWENETYRTISITSGTDIANPDLIVWLTENATLLITDDLTGWTWVGNSVDINTQSIWSYSIDFYLTNVGSWTIRHSIYTANGGLSPVNNLYYDTDMVYEGDVYNWTSTAYKTITITGGTDATNSNLIAWLQANGTLTAPQPTPVKTFDLSTLQLSAGTHTIRVRARAQNYRDSNFSNSVSYVVSPPSYTINFAINYEYNTGSKIGFRIYDGQDNTGTLLYESLGDTPTLTPQTLTCTSGYLTFEFETYESGDPCSFSFTNTGGVSPASASDSIWGVHDETFTITGNGTITINYIDWED